MLYDGHQILHQLQRLTRDMDFFRRVDRVFEPPDGTVGNTSAACPWSRTR